MYYLKLIFDCDDKSFSFLNALNQAESKKIQSAYTLNNAINFVYHPLTRSNYAKYGLLAIIATTFDTLIAVPAAAFSIFTIGQYSFVNISAKNFLRSLGLLLSEPYRLFLKTLNPKAKFLKHEISRQTLIYGGREKLEQPLLLTGLIHRKLKPIIEDWINSERFLTQQIGSRLMVTGLMIGSIAARVLDFFVGVVTGVGSILYLGSHRKLNRMAYSGLQITGIFSDAYCNGLRIIYPRALFVPEVFKLVFPKKRSSNKKEPSVWSRIPHLISKVKDIKQIKFPGLGTYDLGPIRKLGSYAALSMSNP